MPNKHYRKGADKERRLVRKAIKAGKYALRSAGSHTPIDVVIIDPKERTIRLIQSKYETFPESQRLKLLEEHGHLDGTYTVTFEVV